jgi:hypothetical protein
MKGLGVRIPGRALESRAALPCAELVDDGRRFDARQRLAANSIVRSATSR